ncbi:multiubiquitin domain-containing protein [Pseudarthrobacter sp. NPDC058329]|uniref:multiubiquitin domain-containing protein n=1 Tax=Pseudarthrobacter sp. NPDC058329 TaxID=3346448 RepID=UPI0036DA6CB0
MTITNNEERSGEQDIAGKGKPKTVITVNRQEVHILGPRVTGAQIKATAIEQGVSIDPGFQLSLQEATGKWSIVGDADTVTVTKNSVFRAVADDDNS